MSKPFRTIDPETLPPHFDAGAAEARWDGVWEKAGIYRWDSSRKREETFVVDTPPPTVSGSLHMGHVFSYTHTDVLVRQRRMRGMNVFYPMGWDDNGLPTERRVQNYFHVRCEPNVPYEGEGFAAKFELASDEKRKKERPTIVSRRTFIELCQRVTHEDEKAFEGLFRRIALSVDWTQTYATIDDRSRTLAQLSFLDLFEKGHLYSIEAPTFWDVDFQTAVAQAEMEDRDKPGAFHHIEFGVEGTSDRFVIATTRPELLPACVGVTAHPDDERFKNLFGKRAVTPLFKAPVPIFPSELADPKKGTGILMVCTFGDQTDVQWWREQGLALRVIVQRDGRLRPVQFGSDEFPSLDPDAANAVYAELAGKTLAQAQKAIVEKLKDPSGSATGNGAPLQGDPKPIQHAVKHYEKGDRPLELVISRQWFVKLMAQKDAMLGKGDQIQWHPDFMRLRYRNWTENLGLDWCVSRQRYFGVPIPCWYPIGADGAIDYAKPLLPSREQLPIDPLSHAPTGYTESQRNQPGGFTGDPDVFDTWFTSSLTPQIGSGWLLDPERHKKLFPADIRPQSHEIIRTWAFYTIAKALLHEGSVPWHHVVISGWILDPDRKKMSKSAGNVVTPIDLLDTYTSDAVRYWAASARLGTDTQFASDQELKNKKWRAGLEGKRLVTKLFNAGKFVLGQTADAPASGHGITHELDRAFVAELRALIERTSASFAELDYAHALQETEQFFWSRFTDTYLELAKIRARGDVGDAAGRTSAVAALRLGLNVLLRLFAPVLPYITEEVWSWAFAAESGHASIHRAPWPTIAELGDVPMPSDPGALQCAIDALTAINKAKTERGASVGRVVDQLELRTNEETAGRVTSVLDDVLASARVKSHRIVTRPGEGFEIGEIAIAPKEAKETAAT
ncbi:valine--tRNA ligase [Sandaracinus amylolyticus]|uniref:valine--tRNA ligase n=1 Tax=Sandaracinus amylolyticus TaxID=927083 RepID=UPI001F0311DA|nr:valine--tRNA ligase [Sandaracinus amylolyticus]UJR80976.1 Valyl-tRNA synthetase [Sandaracinus amylolyticus]